MRISIFSNARSSHSKCCEGFSTMKCGTVPSNMLLSPSLSADEHVVLPVRCWGKPCREHVLHRAPELSEVIQNISFRLQIPSRFSESQSQCYTNCNLRLPNFIRAVAAADGENTFLIHLKPAPRNEFSLYSSHCYFSICLFHAF